MMVIEADEATYNKWHKFTNKNGRFEFKELPDGRKIIHAEILNSPDFPEICKDLCKLPIIEYHEQDN